MRFKLALSTFTLCFAASASAELINIDFGNNWNDISDTYGAASGQSGFWNIGDTHDPQPTILSDTSGSITSVTMNILAESTGNTNPPSSDDGQLLNDMVWSTGGFWSVEFENLSNGTYDIYYYAPDHSMPTSDMTINGTLVSNLTGNISTLVQGTSWDVLTDVIVSEGLLMIDAGPANYTWSGIAGLQLVQTSASAVPIPGAAYLFITGLLGLGLARRKKEG